MKKITIFIATIFILISPVQATESGSGVIGQIDLRAGYILINGFEYQIQKKRTKVYSGEHQLTLRMLKRGVKVKFVSDDGVVTKIRLVKPYVFRG